MKAVDQHSIPMRLALDHCNTAEVAAIPSFPRCMEYTLARGPWANDKDAARRLGIDPALYSRRRHGEAPWTVQDVRNVMVLSGSLAPLVWLARDMGYDLVMRETEAERQLKELRAEIETERRDRKVVEDALRRMLVGQAI